MREALPGTRPTRYVVRQSNVSLGSCGCVLSASGCNGGTCSCGCAVAYPGFQRGAGGASGQARWYCPLQARYKKWGAVWHIADTLSLIVNGYNFGRGGSQAPGAPSLDTPLP